jgi:hypothetical protein
MASRATSATGFGQLPLVNGNFLSRSDEAVKRILSLLGLDHGW